MRTVGTTLVVLFVRFIFRTVDLLTLAGPLRRAYLVAWRGLPSAYRTTFATALLGHERGLSPSSFIYGEAFVCVARSLLGRHGVGAGSRVLDLGCGRGNVLLAARCLGAQACGVELVREHLQVVGDALRAVGISIHAQDARDARIDDASHVWLSWATWDSALRTQITTRLQDLKSGSIVVSVLWDLNDDVSFAVIERARAAFSWGWADVVVSRRR